MVYPSCPLCYPLRKTTKPVDRPTYDYAYGKHWYSCWQDDKHWSVSTEHHGPLTWDAWLHLGFELRGLLWHEHRRTGDFKELIVKLKQEQGHVVMTIEHVS